jgi:hypothetical protein
MVICLHSVGQQGVGKNRFDAGTLLIKRDAIVRFPKIKGRDKKRFGFFAEQ